MPNQRPMTVLMEAPPNVANSPWNKSSAVIYHQKLVPCVTSSTGTASSADHLWVKVGAGRLGMAACGEGIQVLLPHDPLVHIGSDVAGGR